MKYKGKKIEVQIPARDKFGNFTGKTVNIVGICQQEPVPNPLLSINLQTVVNRMPIELKSLSDIKILEE